MKRALSIILSVFILVFTIPVCAAPAFAGAVKSDVKKYTFHWGEYFTQEPRTVDCYYSDSYFKQDSSIYNNHLASASMAMSLTGTRSLKSENAIEALKLIGCKRIVSIKRSGSKAVVIGKKKISDGILVVINTKATYGFCEWDNNVYFGEDGDVAGYADISQATYEKLVDYVKDYKNVKFWIMGHSRGGGIANLVAKDLSDTFGKENVYAYCFDNPYTTTEKAGNTEYTNIHNVEINDSGASVLIPEYMGFGRYGTIDKVFTALDGQDAEMKEMLGTISDIDYLSGQDFRWAKIDTNLLDYLDVLTGESAADLVKSNLRVGKAAPQKEFWDEALALIKKVIPSRKAFTQEISSNAKAAAKEMGYTDAYTLERAARSFAVHLYNIIQYKDIPDHEEDLLMTGGKNLLKSPKLVSLILPIVPVLYGETPSVLKCSYKYANWVDTLWEESKLSDLMTEEEQKDTKLMLATFCETVIKLVKYDFGQKHQIIGTALYNTHRLYDCHVPVATMAYLMADDDYYKKQ